ncbi:MAG: hypothetical protein GY759_03185 [Chloroflexi bacterium]|nr:hypothetical protein [Chloroflexota bacterium]
MIESTATKDVELVDESRLYDILSERAGTTTFWVVDRCQITTSASPQFALRIRTLEQWAHDEPSGFGIKVPGQVHFNNLIRILSDRLEHLKEAHPGSYIHIFTNSPP